MWVWCGCGVCGCPEERRGWGELRMLWEWVRREGAGMLGPSQSSVGCACEGSRDGGLEPGRDRRHGVKGVQGCRGGGGESDGARRSLRVQQQIHCVGCQLPADTHTHTYLPRQQPRAASLAPPIPTPLHTHTYTHQHKNPLGRLRRMLCAEQCAELPAVCVVHCCWCAGWPARACHGAACGQGQGVH